MPDAPPPARWQTRRRQDPRRGFRTVFSEVHEAAGQLRSKHGVCRLTWSILFSTDEEHVSRRRTVHLLPPKWGVRRPTTTNSELNRPTLARRGPHTRVVPSDICGNAIKIPILKLRCYPKRPLWRMSSIRSKNSGRSSHKNRWGSGTGRSDSGRVSGISVISCKLRILMNSPTVRYIGYTGNCNFSSRWRVVPGA